MKLTHRSALASTLFLSFAAINAHAALYDRGNGMIYDSSQNITWLQDANYAKTSGYTDRLAPAHITVDQSIGAMTRSEAATWAASLVYGGVSSWRLPAANLLNSGICQSNDGTCDLGWNNTRSELGHLYYQLGNLGLYPFGSTPTLGLEQSDIGFIHTSFVDAGTAKTVSFVNVQLYLYWLSGTFKEISAVPAFGTNDGGSYDYDQGSLFYAWAVHDGDIANVSSVPIPAAAWLFSSGLLGLIGAARRKAT